MDNMLHKISDLCDKINTIKDTADRLRALKYNTPKTPEKDIIINKMIETIQADCYLVANDKSDYNKEG